MCDRCNVLVACGVPLVAIPKGGRRYNGYAVCKNPAREIRAGAIRVTRFGKAPKERFIVEPKTFVVKSLVARDKTRDTVTTHSIMKHVDTAQRTVLSNQTNASHTNPYPPGQRHLKRRVSSESTVNKKRLRVEKTQPDLQTRGDVHEDLTTSSGHRKCTIFRALRTMQMRSRRVIDGASSKLRTRTYKFWLIARPSLFQTITRVICVLSKVRCLSIPFTG